MNTGERGDGFVHKYRQNRLLFASSIILVIALLAGCAAPAPEATPAPRAAGEALRVVATTTIVGDVVRQVAGDNVELTVLLGIGAEPHTYEPTPSEMTAVYDADVLFANGAGLEQFLDRMLESAGGSALTIELAEGLRLLEPAEEPDEHADEDEHEGEFDPHVWFSVANVIHWVERIQTTLARLDPPNAGAYEANARTYIQQLEELDRWIFEEVDAVPSERRKLVTNHAVFTYFAEQYGFEQVGTVYPVGPGTSPSAREIGALQDAIREFDVPAVFTESTVNPRLAQQVAEDTGIRIVQLYTDSLGPAGSGAETYTDMMRYNVRAIVEGLREGNAE
jgi:ABC-type Zn uptake system ZnuABC Zn-binding protein ZnuA